MTEAPHAILDTVIYKDNRFLRMGDKSADKIIYNQSAGHLKPAKLQKGSLPRKQTGRSKSSPFLVSVNTPCHMTKSIMSDIVSLLSR